MLRADAKVLLILLVPIFTTLSANSAYTKESNAKTKGLSPAEKEYELARAGGSPNYLKHMNNAIRLDPKYEQAYMARAIFWMNGQKPAEAVKDFSSVISLNPRNYRALNFRASCYATLENWPLALKDYNKQIELSPRASSAYRNRSYVYRRMGRTDLAQKDLAMVEDLRWNRAMGVPAREKTPETQIEECTRGLKTQPNSRELYLVRGLTYKQTQKYALAVQDLTKGLSIDPEKSLRHINYNMDQIYYDRANCYENLHQYNKAIADYDAILKMDDDAEEAFLYRGDCYFKLGNYEKAVADYTETIKHDIDHLQKPYLCRAKAYEKLGKVNLAKADIAKAKALGPGGKQ